MSTATDLQIAQSRLLQSILSDTKTVDNRDNLGPMVPIRLFQALRLIALGTGLEEMLGDGSRALVYQSGQRLGQVLGGAVKDAAEGQLDHYVELVRGLCIQLSIGQVVPEKVDLDRGELGLRVDECVSCAGIQGTSGPICHFETGMVGGIVREFLGAPVRAVETRCNAVGDKTCAIQVKVI